MVITKFILTILLLVSFVFAETEGLKMNLKLDRDTVYVADPFFSLFLTIRNTSQSSKKVLDISSYQKRELANNKNDGLKSIITSQTGETLNLTIKQWMDYPTPFPDYLITLSPSESILTLLHTGSHLNNYYGGNLRNSMGKLYGWPVRGLSAGVYRIKVSWRDISSNELVLTIKQPEGKLADAYDLYLEVIGQLDRQKGDEKLSPEGILEKITERINARVSKFEDENYNFEPYAPMALEVLYRTSLHYAALFKKTLEIQPGKIYKKIVENYPNSQVAKWLITRPSLERRENFQSKDEYNNYLQYIAEKYPGTLVGDEAKRILESKKER